MLTKACCTLPLVIQKNRPMGSGWGISNVIVSICGISYMQGFEKSHISYMPSLSQCFRPVKVGNNFFQENRLHFLQGIRTCSLFFIGFTLAHMLSHIFILTELIDMVTNWFWLNGELMAF